MTMEELVQRLAELQARQKMEEDAADETSAWIDGQIEDAEAQLKMLNTQRDELRKSHIDPIEKVIEQIVDVQQEIIEAWNPETMKKTMRYPAGTLKFRTSESLVIEKEALVLTGLLDHTSVKDVADNYISGFNKTAVKKYMGVISLPMGAACINRKTTVTMEGVD